MTNLLSTLNYAKSELAKAKEKGSPKLEMYWSNQVKRLQDLLS